MATPAAVIEQLRRLAGLRFPPTSTTTHVEALGPLTVEDLEAGITSGLSEWREFPSPAEILEHVARVQARVVYAAPEDRSVPIDEPTSLPWVGGAPLAVTRAWVYHCEACRDTGWAAYWCGDTRPDGAVRSHCGRGMAHGAHEWVAACSCVSSNPDVQRKRQQQVAAAAERLAQGRAHGRAR